jgi:hypothetical protein
MTQKSKGILLEGYDENARHVWNGFFRFGLEFSFKKKLFGIWVTSVFKTVFCCAFGSIH